MNVGNGRRVSAGSGKCQLVKEASVGGEGGEEMRRQGLKAGEQMMRLLLVDPHIALPGACGCVVPDAV